MSKENNNKENNEENKINKKMLIAAAVLIVAALAVWGIVAAVSKSDSGNKDGNDGANRGGVESGVVQQSEETLRPDAKPTFKFFYNSSDERAAELMAVIEELQQTYGDRVIFDISDLDEHPEYVEQFSIITPPQLYMLEADGNFADIKMGVYDKAELEDAINKVFE